MSKIGFLTDSCSDIPQELADKYGIEVVGFPINLDGVEYMERKDFTNDQFYQMMRDAQGVPTTAAITQLQFCDIYARYADEGYTDLVYLSINAGGSSTYNNAVKAGAKATRRPGMPSPSGSSTATPTRCPTAGISVSAPARCATAVSWPPAWPS